MKFNVICGLKAESNCLSKLDLIHDFGYGKKAEFKTKKLINKNTDCIISFGFAGGLTKTLKTGDIIFGENIIWRDKSINETSKKFFVYFKKKLKGKEIKTVDVLCSKSVVNKQKICNFNNLDNKPVAVDMESEYIQKVANKYKIPFVCIRVILDDYNHPIPNFIIQSLKKNGDIDLKKLLINVFKNPKKISKILELFFMYTYSIKVLKKTSEQIFQKKKLHQI